MAGSLPLRVRRSSARITRKRVSWRLPKRVQSWSASPTPRLAGSPALFCPAGEVLVLRHELARDKRRALLVGEDRHPDPGRVKRRDHDRGTEVGGLLPPELGDVG